MTMKELEKKLKALEKSQEERLEALRQELATYRATDRRELREARQKTGRILTALCEYMLLSTVLEDRDRLKEIKFASETLKT